jgi:hypothetical protein
MPLSQATLNALNQRQQATAAGSPGGGNAGLF